MTTGTVTEGQKKIEGSIYPVPTVDRTLTKSGHCADAKVVGDALEEIRRKLAEVSAKVEG